MKIENEFTVNAPIQQAWGAMLDLEQVAPCLPGAAIEEATDGEYQGTMAVKLGPISTRYRGTVKIEEANEENHRAVLSASGKETRGQGSASATIISTMSEENGATRVHVETDVQVTGRVAQFGRGIMQDVAEELMGRFSTCVEQEIVGRGEASEQRAGVADEEGEPPEERGAFGRVRTGLRETAPDGVEPLNLGDVSRKAVVRRAAPVLAGLAGLSVVALLLRFSRRSSFSIKFEATKR